MLKHFTIMLALLMTVGTQVCANAITVGSPNGWIVTWSSKRMGDLEKTTAGIATQLDEYFFSSKEICELHLLNHFVVQGDGTWIATSHIQAGQKRIMIELFEQSWMSNAPSYHCSSLSSNK